MLASFAKVVAGFQTMAESRAEQQTVFCRTTAAHDEEILHHNQIFIYTHLIVDTVGALYCRINCMPVLI